MRYAKAILPLLLAGCVTHGASTERVWTIDQVRRHIIELDGQTIVVSGWLPRCGGRDCSIYASKRAEELFWENLGHSPMLSIGSAPEFDRAVRDQVPAQIVLRARVKADCFRRPSPNPDGTQDIIICGDRVSDLIPLQIISLQPAPRSSQDSARK